MAYLAPGHRRRTAWAITCAVEWRRTSRPASLVSVTMATRSPWRSSVLRSTSRPFTVATTAALARPRPMEWASSAAVVPSVSSRCEPSGRSTEMTPAIVHPYLLLSRRIAPGPDTVVVSQGYWTHLDALRRRRPDEAGRRRPDVPA